MYNLLIRASTLYSANKFMGTCIQCYSVFSSVDFGPDSKRIAHATHLIHFSIKNFERQLRALGRYLVAWLTRQFDCVPNHTQTFQAFVRANIPLNAVYRISFNCTTNTLKFNKPIRLFFVGGKKIFPPNLKMLEIYTLEAHVCYTIQEITQLSCILPY